MEGAAGASATATEALLTKSGYLTKQGHRVKSWKRRHFVVANGLLSYYDAAGDAKHLGQINVANCALEVAPTDRFKRAHVFVITAATGETLVLQVRRTALAQRRGAAVRVCGAQPMQRAA